MWKPEWAKGRIRDKARATMWFAWGFSAIWMLISLPLVFRLPEEVFEKGNVAAALGLLFPLVGLGLVFWALKATLRYRKFGFTEMELKTLPGAIGGRLQGTLHTGLRQVPVQVHIVLSCVHLTESRGRRRDVRESLLWQDEYTLSPAQVEQGMRGLAFPVDFVIPRDCRQTDESNRESRIIWRLEASAEMSGPDYHSLTEVPVFETAESSDEVPEPSRFVKEARQRQRTRGPQGSKVRLSPTPAGGRQFYFPPARNKGAALSLTVFTLIFAGITTALVIWGFSDGGWFSPLNLFFLLFPAVFGFVTLLLVLFTLDSWFGATRVVIEDGRLRVRNAILGLGRWKEISCHEIAGIKLGIGMQQKQTMTQSAKAYYDIEVHPKNGRRFKVGRAVRNKREAEWLVEQMSQAVDSAPGAVGSEAFEM